MTRSILIFNIDDVISFLDRMSNDINQKISKQSLLITKDQLLILFHIKL